MMHIKKLVTVFFALLLLIFGCSSSDDNGNGTDAFTLQLLHFADIDGNEEIALDAVGKFSALVNGFQNDASYGANTIVVSSGDNIIPGPRYYSVDDENVESIHGSDEPGSTDNYFLNQFGVVASALGNHELDMTPGEFDDTINKDDFTTNFPYLACNVDFTNEFSDSLIGIDGSDYASLAGQVAGYATVTVGGQTIGLVGVSTPSLPNITSTGDLQITPGTSWTAQELADEVQPSIDALIDTGVNKIIVLAHLQQLSYEKELAPLLSGVDIIVAGGSNTRMGDSNDTLFEGDTAFDETYPYRTTDTNGNPILIVNVDGDYKYLGRLVVGFDSNGVINLNSLDDTLNGAWASTEANVRTSGGAEISTVATMRDAIQNYINSLYSNVVGYTNVYLDGRRSEVRTEETNLGDLTADANLWYANLYATANSESYVQISIKNGGGIRTEIGESVVIGETYSFLPPQASTSLGTSTGAISEGHVKSTLKFNNGLVVFEVSADQLKQILEATVAYVEPGSTPGSFPQLSGMKIGYDYTQTAQVVDDSVSPATVTTEGTRIRHIVVDTDGDGAYDDTVVQDGIVVGTGTYRLVTLNYLLGTDYEFIDSSAGYALYADPEDDWTEYSINGDPGRSDSLANDVSDPGKEQDALVEYLLLNHPDSANGYNVPETEPANDTRVQDLSLQTWVP
jgi:2',3'-cyclic-nucleotide 2'-phosphodiesterase (5'-nucleotidase family)